MRIVNASERVFDPDEYRLAAQVLRRFGAEAIKQMLLSGEEIGQEDLDATAWAAIFAEALERIAEHVSPIGPEPGTKARPEHALFLLRHMRRIE